MITITVNKKSYAVDVSPSTPLLWVIRDIIGLTGTKFGCGMALCGACTIHLDGEPVRSCVTPVSHAAGKQITTIEGLSEGADGPESIGKRLQQAWLVENTPQCGYCQSGQIMSAAALLHKISQPTDADIDTAMSGNICRCGTYQRIRKAIHRAAGNKEGGLP
ncbi:(2Fe-2S)-binding protein [Flavitalea flava]